MAHQLNRRDAVLLGSRASRLTTSECLGNSPFEPRQPLQPISDIDPFGGQKAGPSGAPSGDQSLKRSLPARRLRRRAGDLAHGMARQTIASNVAFEGFGQHG